VQRRLKGCKAYARANQRRGPSTALAQHCQPTAAPRIAWRETGPPCDARPQQCQPPGSSSARSVCNTQAAKLRASHQGEAGAGQRSAGSCNTPRTGTIAPAPQRRLQEAWKGNRHGAAGLLRDAQRPAAQAGAHVGLEGVRALAHKGGSLCSRQGGEMTARETAGSSVQHPQRRAAATKGRTRAGDEAACSPWLSGSEALGS